MNYIDLKEKLSKAGGHFNCRGIRNESDTKTVQYVHVVTPALAELELTGLKEQLGQLPELIKFYSTFGSVRLYADPVSGDSAFYISSPDEWGELNEGFQLWIADLDEDEEGSVPDWVADSITIGEIPQTGNYLLMPSAGDFAGRVFEFEHDGFEFIEVASDLHNFIELMLSPNADRLTEMASHMRFCEAGYLSAQWWIVSHEDENGNVVETEI